jgi:hypothetical protein
MGTLQSLTNRKDDREKWWLTSKRGSIAIKIGRSVYIAITIVSIIYVIKKLETPDAVLVTPEILLILGFVGLNMLGFVRAQFWTGLALAFVAISISSSLNQILVQVVPTLASPSDLYAEFALGLNFFTICFGFGVAIAITGIFMETREVLYWAVMNHFLVLSIAQRDQFGLEFSPYKIDNVLQWLPSLLFIAIFLTQKYFVGRPHHMRLS